MKCPFRRLKLYCIILMKKISIKLRNEHILSSFIFTLNFLKVIIFFYRSFLLDNNHYDFNILRHKFINKNHNQNFYFILTGKITNRSTGYLLSFYLIFCYLSCYPQAYLIIYLLYYFISLQVDVYNLSPKNILIWALQYKSSDLYSITNICNLSFKKYTQILPSWRIQMQ